MTIRLRLLSGILLIASLVGAVGYLSWHTNGRIQKQVALLSESSVLELVDSTQMIDLLQGTHVAAEDILRIIGRLASEENPATRKQLDSLSARYLDIIQDNVERLDTHLTHARAAAEHAIALRANHDRKGGPDANRSALVAWVEPLEVAFAAYREMVHTFTVAIGAGPDTARLHLVENMLPHYRQEMIPLLVAYRDRSESTLHRQFGSIRAAIAAENNRIVAITLLAVAAALIVSLVLSRRILTPLGALKSAAEHISRGRTDVRAVVRSRDEIGMLAAAFNQMVEDLQAVSSQLESEMARRLEAEQRARSRGDQLAHVTRLSTMGELAVNLAHELNQPLAALTTYTQSCARMLRGGASSESDLTATMQKAVAQACRASGIVQRLRDSLLVPRSSRTSEDLAKILHEALEVLEPVRAASHVDVRVEIPLAVGPICVDRVQIDQVLNNLIRNAIDAMVHAEPGSRALTITARRQPDGVEVAVSDAGPGCSDEQIERMFEPFFTTKEPGSNMGLGLSICRSIVEEMGGRLGAVRNPTGGLTISFTVPQKSQIVAGHDDAGMVEVASV